MIKKAVRKLTNSTKRQDETLGGAARSLVEAVVFLILLVLFVSIVVLVGSCISRNRVAPEDLVVQEEPTAKLPWDVPLYKGAALSRYTRSGGTAIYEYDIAQGSLDSVQLFYKEQLDIHEWIRQPRSSQYVSEYTQGDRTLTISLSYRSGSVHMKIQIVTKKP